MRYIYGMPGETPFVDFDAIHREAGARAAAAYRAEYGIDFHDDPEWEIGNERHAFWLRMFDVQQAVIVLN